MRKLILVAPLSVIALAACGSRDPATENLDTANIALNVMVANEVAAANGVADEPETKPEAPVAPAPAPAPTAAAKPAPKPPEPKPGPDSECAPEHRAAGHC